MKISLDIDEEDNTMLEKIAKERGIKKATLIRIWLKEKMP